jgi:hypothetical protein
LTYIQVNLTLDHSAIYHSNQWGEAKLVDERSSGRRIRKGNNYHL